MSICINSGISNCGKQTKALCCEGVVCELCGVLEIGSAGGIKKVFGILSGKEIKSGGYHSAMSVCSKKKPEEENTAAVK